MEITYRTIGLIRSQFTEIQDMPIQPSGAKGERGRVELDPDLEAGLADLEGFSHLYLLYHFHLVKGVELHVTPFLDTRPRGLFATRAPKRPNPIGLSVVRLLGIQGPVLEIEDIDVLDRTPLLDLKPYVPEFDQVSQARVGWMEAARGQVRSTRSDGRFG